MPIPFRDAADLDELGVACFLRIERSARGSTYLGALFSVNARGEPIELVYNALETPYSFLWRPSDLRRHAERRLTASLLAAAETTPGLLFCLTGEVMSEMFTHDLRLDVPVGRVEPPPERGRGGQGRRERGAGDEAAPSVPDAAHVFWQPAPPADGSPARGLFDQLVARGLLMEPFDRASDGLREVYGRREDEAAAGS